MDLSSTAMIQKRAYQHSGTSFSLGVLSPVSAVFLILFIVLLVPSRIWLYAHLTGTVEEKYDVFFASTARILIIWFFLYRLTVQATNQMWAVAVSISALYLATFLYLDLVRCALTVFVLFLVDCFASHLQKESRRAGQSASPSIDHEPASLAHSDTSVIIRSTGIVAHADASRSPPIRVNVIPLDPICEPYGYILFSARIVRAAMASVASSTAIFGLLAPVLVVFWSAHDSKASFLGDLVTIGYCGIILSLLAGVGALCFFVLHALWRGSIKVACIVLVISGLSAIGSVFDLITSLQRELIFSGLIWYYFAAFALNISVTGALAMGSMTIVKRRKDITLMRILRENAERDWRTAMMQLCGIILPRRVCLKVLKFKSVVLSILAFCIEGAAFYSYFNLPNALSKCAQAFPSLAKSINPVEGHYLSIVTIACFVAPITFVWIQLALSGAECIRSIAKRASLLSAEEALREDQRPPVLFLRDFDNDQVSLNEAAMPAYVHLLDSRMKPTNLEEVLQSCLNLGPVIALGRPEDLLFHRALPPIGASRTYVQDGRWQEEVVSLMDAASLIVVGVSESEGVSWEIKQLVKRGHSEKSIFIIPDKSRNRRLVNYLLSELLPVSDEAHRERVAAALESTIGEAWVAGVMVRHGTVKVLVSHRGLSQVQYDVALRLATLEEQGMTSEGGVKVA